MSRVRIIGIGSPSGDDQAGWLVVDALREAGLGNAPDWIIDKLDRPGAKLIPLLQDADHVILIDAMQGGGAAGTLRHFERADWPAYPGGVSTPRLRGAGSSQSRRGAGQPAAAPGSLRYRNRVVAAGEAPCAAVRAAALSLASCLRGELGDRSPR